MDNTAVFEEGGECDNDALDTVDIHTDVPLKESGFEELIENSDNDCDHEWGLAIFFDVTEWRLNIFIEIRKCL